ncbi:MAG: NAD(P)(+) transhydrogenase (Re/Si-specific) subunit beta, partial [Amphiplicatus sp.]
MAENLPALLYIASGILFILALRGLSSPETARAGNRFGMIGMAIAVLTTLFMLENKNFLIFLLILVAIAPGAAAGAYIARKVPMTAMPQLVAAFHSLVGLAAVFIAWAAFLAPRAFGVGEPGEIHLQSVIEMSLGCAIGAITFSGSIIAF